MSITYDEYHAHPNQIISINTVNVCTFCTTQSFIDLQTSISSTQKFYIKTNPTDLQTQVSLQYQPHIPSWPLKAHMCHEPVLLPTKP